jgi:hypothetical protein
MYCTRYAAAIFDAKRRFARTVAYLMLKHAEQYSRAEHFYCPTATTATAAFKTSFGKIKG